MLCTVQSNILGTKYLTNFLTFFAPCFNRFLKTFDFSREDFVEYGKHSKAIKDYVEKVEREGSSSKQNTPKKAGKVDKATAAFKVDMLLCLSLIIQFCCSRPLTLTTVALGTGRSS